MKSMHRPKGVRSAPQQDGSLRGFTFVELLVVLAIIAVLASLLSSALNQTKAKAHQITCLSNLKQLSLAWHGYFNDNDDQLPLNKSEDGANEKLFGRRNALGSWVVGNPKEDITTRNIVKGTLYPYARFASMYRCPDDRSTVVGHPFPRTRSYSMSFYMNGDAAGIEPRVKTLFSAIDNPSPEKVFVFIEEHENSVWSGSFSVVPPEKGVLAAPIWVSTPAERHNRGYNLSFADGHVEYWKWYSSKSLLPASRPSADRHEIRDLRRLQDGVPKP
ncbi:MAG: prepilin-type N-terminal cleavage/methylation domain-containing protein [Verrucomicrobia bacterium]|nr:prepilin-type N-terminal cleavage/methylation domain-containing protein [Verrucomicrobiota bacterium]